MLGNELNLWIGLLLLWGGLSLIVLGNWPHTLDNGPYLSTGTFCPVGRFVLRDVLSLGRFFLWGVWFLGTFCPWDVLSWDVLS